MEESGTLMDDTIVMDPDARNDDINMMEEDDDDSSSTGSGDDGGNDNQKGKTEMAGADELRRAGIVSKYAKLEADTAFTSRTPRYPISLAWYNVCYKVVLQLPPTNIVLRQLLRLPIPDILLQFIKTKRVIPILNNISGTVETGKMLAIMGPTGSGKTTLLNVLAKRVQKNVTGHILVNGKPVKGQRMKRRMAYVLQDDTFFPNLTVRNTISCTAELRLPRKLGKKEKKQRVEEVLSELGLQRCSNTIIGGRFSRGVSGGERKRTNIANEIVNNASLIFLDEPTTGLDAATSMGLVVSLKNLSRNGHTVVTTIHQPSSAMFMLFDNVLLLAEGGFPVFHGAGRDVLPYFASLGLHSPSHYNPADFMLELVTTLQKTEDTNQPIKEYLIEKYNELKKGGSPYLVSEKPVPSEFDTDGISNAAVDLGADSDDKSQQRQHTKEEMDAVRDIKRGAKFPTPFWKQLSVLTVRSFKQRLPEAINWWNTIQLFLIAVCVGILWLNMSFDESRITDRSGLLFYSTMYWCLNSWTSALSTFPMERAVINKERASGVYRLSAYFLGKTLAEFPLAIVLPTLANVIIYWMTGLNRDGYTFIVFLIFTNLFVLLGSSLGLFISAVFMDMRQSLTITIIALLASVLLGGFFVQGLPVWIAWARWCSFIKYGYEALLINEFKLGKDVTFHNDNPSAYTERPITGDDILDKLNVETTIWGDFIFIFGLIFVAQVGSYLALRFLNRMRQ
eukprot:TRINITY_DN1228_c0_g1_i2.p1 TRINITY_DN1228_c0_g1~~TRINITY_DN1228_c0_g1_i2.p1  ORF type:complete len:769 (+),score=143.42 TRINITY_DN1228_c0_g1_i2:107-2308(+)